MVWLAYIYVAFMVISLPFGIVILRRLKPDLVHPVGCVLSTFISMAFVLSVWFPELIPFHGKTTWGLWFFAVGWDLYTLNELRNGLHKVLAINEEDAKALNKGALLAGLAMMLPAYACGLYVCLRVGHF